MNFHSCLILFLKLKIPYRYEITYNIYRHDNLALVESNNLVCLFYCNIFEMINKSQKGLNWSFIPSCHLPSTEKPILLGFTSLFTLAGLHLLLLLVTAIKISSRSAVMVNSCHCVEKNGKVQHYWNVLELEREERGRR